MLESLQYVQSTVEAVLTLWKSCTWKQLALYTILLVLSLICAYPWLFRSLQDIRVYNDSGKKIWIRCSTKMISVSSELLHIDADVRLASEENFFQVEPQRNESCYAGQYGFTVYVSILAEQEGDSPISLTTIPSLEKLSDHIAVNHPVDPYNDVLINNKSYIEVGHFDSGEQAVQANFIWYLNDVVRWHSSTYSILRGIYWRYRVDVENRSGETLNVTCVVQHEEPIAFTVIPPNVTVTFERSPTEATGESSFSYAISAGSRGQDMYFFKERIFDISLSKLTIKEGGEIEKQEYESRLKLLSRIICTYGMILAIAMALLLPVIYILRRKRSPNENPVVSVAKLCVSHLPDEVTEAQLFEKFSTVGPVSSVEVVRDPRTHRSKGSAYVEFKHPNDAERAIDILYGEKINGEPLFLSWPADSEQGRLNSQRRLHVLNLDADVDDDALRHHFEKFGSIAKAKVTRDKNGQSRGFGFVHFEKVGDATKAQAEMNGTMIGSKSNTGNKVLSRALSPTARS
uniref:RRM domain-containing protein n=1 Tax=Steinernema glaseri TaxID=37863 RepID=A0A1I8AAS1_9BILA